MLTFLLSSTSKLKTVHLQGFWSKTVYLKKTVHLQGFWPKTVYLKCFGIQLKTVYLQGPCSSRPCISRPCCTKFVLIFKYFMHVCTPTHIFKAPSAPDCTKIAAPTCVRARTHTNGLLKTPP